MRSETRTCQNCKAPFLIDASDFNFYEKIKVPPPTWCPECRMIRRFVFRNERKLFKVPDAITGKEIFSMYHPATPTKVYQKDYWWSDAWDPMEYGKDYDFSKPFFEQFKELLNIVPRPSRAGLHIVNSEYVNNCGRVKNGYLCFYGTELENSAYVIGFTKVSDSLDLYQSRHSELCYDSYMVDECSRVFFSVNCEECTDIWFSRNLLGCSNCFGCINLRNKSYHLFNKPVSKEEYKKFIAEFESGSHSVAQEMRDRAHRLWAAHPQRFTLAINVVNSTGEHIEHAKNVRDSFIVHEAENLRYCQMLEDVTDSYDHTLGGKPSTRVYEALAIVLEAEQVKFSIYCFPGVYDLEYCFECHSSSDLFGCVGLKKKQYCILNKQYSKNEYTALREKIIQHMNDMSYTDKQGRVYTYGEFFPPEFSPFAYNETIAQDFFTLSKAEAESRGFLWREPEEREYKTTRNANDLPDNIKDVSDDVLKEIIACASCGKAYRIIQMELNFYRRIPLPLPRLCPDCRFKARFQYVNPPKFWHATCQCAGKTSDAQKGTDHRYTNAVQHFHGEHHCPNEFETSYAPEKNDITYCEKCYQAEAV